MKSVPGKSGKKIAGIFAALTQAEDIDEEVLCELQEILDRRKKEMKES